MSSDLESPSDDRSTFLASLSKRGRLFAAGSAALALTVSASLAIGRIQDPAEAPQDAPKAKTKDAAKKAQPKPEEEAPPVAEPAPDTPRKVELPPPPGFSKAPKTPSEVWEVVDYLIRSRQAPAAVPYIRQFIDLNPDDATLLAVREELGDGSFLRLGDHEATRPFLKPIHEKLAAAIVKRTNDPERIRSHVAALAKSPDERKHAINEIRPAGSNAVPVILEAYRAAQGNDRELIGQAFSRLDRNAGPALVAMLDSKDESEVNTAAAALAAIGDERAIPALTWVAARSEGPGKAEAAKAIEKLTGLSFSAQHKTPAQVLADAARRCHLRALPLSDNPTIHVWDEGSNLPVGKAMTKTEALGLLGSKYARQALTLDPSNADAQLTLLALTLDRTQGNAVPPTVLAAGSDVLGRLTKQAIADRRPDVAVKALAALGKVSDRNSLSNSARTHALVEALAAPDRRVQFAAVEALINLEPKSAFPGSSRVVPILARFAANPRRHGVIVIDGNPARGSQVVGHLTPLGYDAQLAQTGEDGFRAASGSANIEIVILNPSYLSGAWTTHDTLSNLRADARTAGLPIFLVGSLRQEEQFRSKYGTFPGLNFLVTPTESTLLKTQINRALNAQGVVPLSEPERAAYALKASQLLTKITQTKGSPFLADLAGIEPNLVLALSHSATSESITSALGDLPGHEAQRGLADVLLNPSQPASARLKAAEALAHSLRRFGPLLTANQEAKLAQALDNESDGALRTAIATVVGALKPKPAAVGRMLRADRFSTITTR